MFSIAKIEHDVKDVYVNDVFAHLKILEQLNSKTDIKSQRARYICMVSILVDINILFPRKS